MEYPGSVRGHHEFHITYMCAYMRVFLAKYPSVEQSRARISSIERKTRGLLGSEIREFHIPRYTRFGTLEN